MSKSARIFFAFVFTTIATITSADFVVVEKGEPKAVITINNDARVTKYAANELIRYVKAMTGATLSIAKVGETGGSNVISIVSSTDGLKREEIVLKVKDKGKVLELTGEGLRGGLNAVYELLEYWGVRYFAVDREKIPSHESLSIPSNYAYSYAPPFERRKPGSIPLDRNIGPPLAVKLRVSREYDNKNYGGRRDGDIGGGHSLGNKYFVNSKTFFDEHPEWYALIDGKRQRKGQLCHSNQEMREQLLKEVLAKAEARKSKGRFKKNGIHYVSLAYLDGTRFCQCDGCKELCRKWGGAQIGPALDVANFIAKAIEKDYPELRVSTLAYWAWREPPKEIPEPIHQNVYVTLCQNGNKALPVARQPELINRLKRWSELVPGRVMIWDWDACFRNYLTPYPAYHLYGEDFRTYRSLGIKCILSQMPHGAIFADFVDMRTYLYAKLAWNPDLDGDALAKEWIDYCCGAGATYIWDYYLLVAKALWGEDYKKYETKYRLHGYNTDRSWLTANDLSRAYILFEKALEATKEDEPSYATIRRLRAGTLQLIIERYDEVKAELEKAKHPFPPRDELVTQFETIGKDFYHWCFREGPQPRNFASLVEKLKNP